jgi:CheY-like chemotaxis protein
VRLAGGLRQWHGNARAPRYRVRGTALPLRRLLPLPLTPSSMPRILWADDEIDLLRPHVLFLESKGYDVTSVTNGADAVEQVRRSRFDVVFLDEQMPGMGGLDALPEIKAVSPETPVVMVTKSEEEHLMEDALGGQIADYLIKPVHPKQLLLTCKRLLEGGRIRDERASQDYLRAFGELSTRLGSGLDAEGWIEVYQQLVRYGTELDADDGARQILDDQYREANREFGRFVEGVYEGWIAAARAGEKPAPGVRPPLSPDVIPRWVLPRLGERPVVFLLVDCMRYDQWLEFERLLYPLYDVEKDWHYSLLPTATPYSRNAIFAGLLPAEIARRYPDLWQHDTGDEGSLNQHEERLLLELLQRKHKGDARVRYEKIVSSEAGQALTATDLVQHDLAAVVVNFVDILAHSRSDSSILKEIAPDERAYRALTRTWFEHSWLLRLFEDLARLDVDIIVTTDHGVVRSLHATKVIGDRDTSTSLRYKHGRNLKADEKHAIFVKNPEAYGLPRTGINENYIFAKEDYYFVYPTNYHRYLNQYMDTFQHGGASLEEMVLPVITLRPRAGGGSR